MFFAIKTLQQETSYAIMPKDNWHVRRITMKKVKTLSNSTLKNTMKKGGCGECQTSCQSARLPVQWEIRAARMQTADES